MKKALLILGFIFPFLLFSISCFGIKTTFAGSVQNQESTNAQITAQKNEFEKTLQAAVSAATEGPITLKLIDQATIFIPKNYLFIPAKEGADFMRAIGNDTGSNFVGFLISRGDKLRWFINIDYIKAGYIRDNDAKNWNADDLLKSIKKNTAEENKVRITKGFFPLEIGEWIETPTYNAIKHQLIWSLTAKDTNSADDPVINYNTYALGREGYFMLDLVTPKSSIEEDKFHAQTILETLAFNSGKRYEDFTAGTDRVAEYGLAALVTGVVAKKLGLIALAGAFFVKMWKLLILLPLLLWNKIKNIIGNNSKTNNSCNE
jgi:uncharacterized membrane-anchored protein